MNLFQNMYPLNEPCKAWLPIWLKRNLLEHRNQAYSMLIHESKNNNGAFQEDPMEEGQIIKDKEDIGLMSQGQVDIIKTEGEDKICFLMI